MSMYEKTFHTPQEIKHEVSWSADTKLKFRDYLAIAEDWFIHWRLRLAAILTVILIGYLIYLITPSQSTFFVNQNPQNNRTSPTPLANQVTSPPSSITQPVAVARNSLLSNERGGYSFRFPDNLTIKPSSEPNALFQPLFYEDSYYFQCVNSQVGVVFPLACWLLQLRLTLGDASGGVKPEIHGDTWIDTQGRSWTITAPVEQRGKLFIFASVNINQVWYLFEMEVIPQSLDDYAKRFPDRLFTEGAATDPTKRPHMLIRSILNTFTVFHKPFLSEWKWERRKIDNNWNIGYPENWDFYLASEVALPSSDIARIEGTYGNDLSVSFHKYSLRLINPPISSYPEVAQQSLEGWLGYELAQILVEKRSQIVITDMKVGKLLAKKLANVPDGPHLYGITSQPGSINSHKLLIWSDENHPPRVVSIVQKDLLPEPAKMSEFLDRFIERIF